MGGALLQGNLSGARGQLWKGQNLDVGDLWVVLLDPVLVGIPRAARAPVSAVACCTPCLRCAIAAEVRLECAKALSTALRSIPSNSLTRRQSMEFE